ncbi:unnamed protein product [Laminaria digitata]
MSIQVFGRLSILEILLQVVHDVMSCFVVLHRLSIRGAVGCAWEIDVDRRRLRSYSVGGFSGCWVLWRMIPGAGFPGMVFSRQDLPLDYSTVRSPHRDSCCMERLNNTWYTSTCAV